MFSIFFFLLFLLIYCSLLPMLIYIFSCLTFKIFLSNFNSHVPLRGAYLWLGSPSSVCLLSNSGCHVLELPSTSIFLRFTYCLLLCLYEICSASLPTSPRSCSASLWDLGIQVGHSLVFALSTLMKKSLSSGEHTGTIVFSTPFNTFSFPVILKFHLSGVLKKKAKTAS